MNDTQNARYFCSGPEAWFWCDDLQFAIDVIARQPDYEEWTVTDLASI